MKAKKNKKSKSLKSKEEDDIVKLILEDHKPLKKLIKVLKDTDRDLDERQDAFDEFCYLLVTHAKPEEEVLYEFLKDEDDLREEGFEGEVEHILADQMLEETKREQDDDIWSAKAKVLAEIVEHHIEDEEDELLPEFKKHCETETRKQLGSEFLDRKHDYERTGTDSPHEYEQHRGIEAW